MSHFNRRNFPFWERISVWSYVLLIFWLGGLGICLAALGRYESTPSPLRADLHNEWPDQSGLQFQPGGWNLVMFVHPRCPCSKASVGELVKILDQFEDRSSLSARAVFYHPHGESPDWGDTAVRRLADAAEDLAILSDLDGQIARRFQAESSGVVYLYTAAGELVFTGGITPGRGLSGLNPGSEIISSYLQNRPLKTNKGRSSRYSLVYGCAIYNADAITQAGDSNVE